MKVTIETSKRISRYHITSADFFFNFPYHCRKLKRTKADTMLHCKAIRRTTATKEAVSLFLGNPDLLETLSSSSIEFLFIIIWSVKCNFCTLRIQAAAIAEMAL